jgi:hypothetical protein
LEAELNWIGEIAVAADEKAVILVEKWILLGGEDALGDHPFQEEDILSLQMSLTLHLEDLKPEAGVAIVPHSASKLTFS